MRSADSETEEIVGSPGVRNIQATAEEEMMSGGVFCPVGKLETVLLSTDCSESSEGAIAEAISFAGRCASRLYALAVVKTDPELEASEIDVYEKEEVNARAHLEAIRQRALREGLSCETIVVRGPEIHEGVIREARRVKADMIVIGRQGVRGIKRLLVGEEAARVINAAPCKVLVMPKDARISFKTILIAVDGSRHSSAAAAAGLGIARRCGSGVVVLSCVHGDISAEDAREYAKNVADAAEKEGLQCEMLTPTVAPKDAIIEVAGGRGCDLIIMGTFGKAGLMKSLMGGSTEQVIGTSKCAVLVERSPES